MRLDLLANATVVYDAIRFVQYNNERLMKLASIKNNDGDIRE
jgi:hypothetical protein